MKTNTLLVLAAILLTGIIAYQIAARQLLLKKTADTCAGKTCMQPRGTCAPGKKCTQ